MDADRAKPDDAAGVAHSMERASAKLTVVLKLIELESFWPSMGLVFGNSGVAS